MANGSVALHVALEPAQDAPARATAGTPSAAATEIEIGVAVANACEALGVALAEGSAPMHAETRTLNGEKLAVVVELWLHHFGEIDDFRGLAQREGVRALRARHGEVLRQQLGENVPETAIVRTFDELCSWVVTAAAQVTAVERVFRAN